MRHLWWGAAHRLLKRANDVILVILFEEGSSAYERELLTGTRVYENLYDISARRGDIGCIIC